MHRTEHYATTQQITAVVHTCRPLPALAFSSYITPGMPAAQYSPHEVANGSAGRQERNEQSSLADPKWAQDMLNDPDNIVIMNASNLLLGETALTPDHMFTAFLRHHLIVDLVSLYNQQRREVYTLYHLGCDIAGHPGLVHGGLTSAMQDETFGILVYMLKHKGVIEAGPAFTARLELDFRVPIPAGAQVLCKCWLDGTERRKVSAEIAMQQLYFSRGPGAVQDQIWLRSEVLSHPGGTLYAEGKALFVNARKGTVNFDHMAAFPPVDSVANLQKVEQQTAQDGQHREMQA